MALNELLYLKSSIAQHCRMNYSGLKKLSVFGSVKTFCEVFSTSGFHGSYLLFVVYAVITPPGREVVKRFFIAFFRVYLKTGCKNIGYKFYADGFFRCCSLFGKVVIFVPETMRQVSTYQHHIPVLKMPGMVTNQPGAGTFFHK